MKEKLFRTVTTLILILCMISLDFVLLGYNVVLALSASEISGDVSTNIQNVEFDAYFKQENTNLYEKQIDVANEDSLYLRINVKNKGVLNNAKMQGKKDANIIKIITLLVIEKSKPLIIHNMNIGRYVNMFLRENLSIFIF